MSFEHSSMKYGAGSCFTFCTVKICLLKLDFEFDCYDLRCAKEFLAHAPYHQLILQSFTVLDKKQVYAP